MNAFKISNSFLHLITPGTGVDHVFNAPPPAGTSSEKKEWSGIDESKPSTSIQIRLPTGSRLVGKFNTTHTIGDVKSFILSSEPRIKEDFKLVVSFPRKVLTDDSETLEAANLLNSSLTVS